MPRGRVVGGSSVTNATIALRGLPEHYDEWNDYVDGYDWDSWLPWFCAIERDLQFGDREYHGAYGPIPINRYPRVDWYPLFERFAEAALGAGHPWVDDHNAPDAAGVGPTPFNMLDGLRQTPADHYLDPALTRPNLTLRHWADLRPDPVRADRPRWPSRRWAPTEPTSRSRPIT